MSGQLLSSKVVVVEEEPKVRGIPGLPTAVAGMVGITERGPIDQAVLCTSFEEFQDRFGGFTPNSDMALAAMGFFENGGSQLWLVRTVHHTDVSDPATAIAVRSFGFLTTPGAPTPALVVSAAAEPFILDDGDRIVVSVDGGADEQATFNGSAAQLPAGGAGPFALTDGQTLTLRFDGGAEQTVTLAAADFVDIGAATADELAAAINAQIAGGKATVETGILNLSSDIEGSSSQVEVTGGTANPTLGFSTGGSDSGAADAVRVEGKDPGAYADQIQAEVRAATNGEAEAFDLAVIEDGVYRETFPNLSMDPSHARYIETIVNDERTGSNLIRVIDQLLAGHPVPDVQTVQLAGGNDGLTVLDDTDFVGSEAGKTGLNAFDQVQDLTMLLVPGRATSAVHNAMVAYCEVDRDGTVFAILDPPANQSATGIVDYVQNTAALIELTEFAAIYWPRVLVLNPAKSVFGPADKIPVPPSGIIAGVYARTDSARPGGVYDPPAGIDKGRMFGVLGFETDEVLEEARRDLVYPKRINPLTTGPGLPRYIDGSRTLKGSGNFPYVAERRGVIFIERSLKQGLQFARHKNNTEGLRAQVRRTITAFLLTQMNNGAFRSREPSKAFFVDVSETLNTPTVIFAGKLIARVGLATNKPAEFIVLRISQDTRALEAELAAAGA